MSVVLVALFKNISSKTERNNCIAVSDTRFIHKENVLCDLVYSIYCAFILNLTTVNQVLCQNFRSYHKHICTWEIYYNFMCGSWLRSVIILFFQLIFHLNRIIGDSYARNTPILILTIAVERLSFTLCFCQCGTKMNVTHSIVLCYGGELCELRLC